MPKQKVTETNKENTPQFYVGYSTERPTQVPLDSIFYEKDTGNRYRYLGDDNWDLIDNIH